MSKTADSPMLTRREAAEITGLSIGVLDRLVGQIHGEAPASAGSGGLKAERRSSRVSEDKERGEAKGLPWMADLVVRTRELNMHHPLQTSYVAAASCGSAVATSWRCASWS
jgi:hypothetical protein